MCISVINLIRPVGQKTTNGYLYHLIIKKKKKKGKKIQLCANIEFYGIDNGLW